MTRWDSKPLPDADKANLVLFEKILVAVAPGVSPEEVMEILYSVLDVQEGRSGQGQVIIRIRGGEMIDIEGQKTTYVKKQIVENTNPNQV